MQTSNRKTENNPASDPGDKRTQAERREKAEREMLKAAVRLLIEKGVSGLTLNDVGEAAGYSRGLPAHYFGRKDVLIARLGHYIVDRYTAGLKRARLERPDSGIETVLRAADYYLESVEKDPLTMRALLVLVTEASNYPDLLSAITDLNRQSVERFAERIRDGQAMGQIRKDIDPDYEAVLLLGQLRGIAAQWLLDQKAISISRLRKTLNASLRRSLTS